MTDLANEVAAYIAAARRFGAPEPRVPLTTEEAIALAKTVTPRHPAAAASAKAFEDLANTEAPKDRAQLTEHLNAMKREEEAFWNAFHGEPYAGGEIVRRRA